MQSNPTQSVWLERLAESLPLFGHRNWIVIADSAYPAHTSPGIETVVTGSDHLDVVRSVLDAISSSAHLRATVYVDHELAFVEEGDAPGIDAFRTGLDRVLAGADRIAMPHEEIIAKLDETARLFRVLLFKTVLTIPYTSVFIELGCGYSCAASAKRLREAMRAQAGAR